jgi:hypothetical protein
MRRPEITRSLWFWVALIATAGFLSKLYFIFASRYIV